MPDAVKPDQFADLGRLLLAFTMLWGYFNFSQFLITVVRQPARGDLLVPRAHAGRLAIRARSASC
jgi:hypothetical protein